MKEVDAYTAVAMAQQKRQKWYDFRDPIHGFIAVKELEKKLIDTYPFQRLRHIRQLGTTFLVYPGANHTRFEHSLGTMYVADQMYDRIVFGYGSDALRELKWNKAKADRYREIVRLAALLHDLGHPPFSHASQQIMPEDLTHEDFTRRIVAETEVRGELEKGRYSAGEIDEIAQIATGTAVKPHLTFLSELITGEIGADRIDYLIRDSHHVGVHYGRFDFHRLLSTMEFAMLPSEEPSEEDPGQRVPSIVVEEGGLHAVEAMLLARYFMFLQVYFHKTRRILDIHLIDCLRQLDMLEGGRFPEALEDYMQWDDDRVLQLLARQRDRPATRRLLCRQHFQVVHRTEPHADAGKIALTRWMYNDLARELGEDLVRLDWAKDKVLEPYTYREPKGIRIHMILEPRAGEYLPLASREIGEEGASQLLESLRPITRMRVYGDRERIPDIQKAIQAFRSDPARGGGIGG